MLVRCIEWAAPMEHGHADSRRKETQHGTSHDIGSTETEHERTQKWERAETENRDKRRDNVVG
jgi:hypothetical protein